MKDFLNRFYMDFDVCLPNLDLNFGYDKEFYFTNREILIPYKGWRFLFYIGVLEKRSNDEY